MNSEEMLLELEKDAEKVGQMESTIPKEKITTLDIEDFYKLKGEKIELDENGKESKTKLIFSVQDNAYYKKNKGEWFKLNLNRANVPDIQIVKENENYETKITNYLSQVKKYVESEISNLKAELFKLDKSTKEGFEELEKKIDLMGNLKKVKVGQ